MAPKSVAPPMTEAEKAELSRLLEKAKMDEDAERAQAASDVGYAKMSTNWATWKPDAADGAGSTTVVKSDGHPFHRNLKSMGRGSGGLPVTTGSMQPWTCHRLRMVSKSLTQKFCLRRRSCLKK